jgi:hypothetical protein
MPDERSFQILWRGLVAGSHVEVTGVTISEQQWLGEVLSLTLTTVPQTASWQIVVTPQAVM